MRDFFLAKRHTRAEMLALALSAGVAISAGWWPGLIVYCGLTALDAWACLRLHRGPVARDGGVG